LFFFSSRRRHTRSKRDWSPDVCSSDLLAGELSVSGTEFSYVYAEDGRCTLIRADRSGELQRWSLEPEKEKLDCCCLTPNGLLARSEERRVGKESVCAAAAT